MKRILLMSIFTFIGVNVKAQTFDWVKIGKLSNELIKLINEKSNYGNIPHDDGRFFLINDEAYLFDYVHNKLYKSKKADLNQFFIRNSSDVTIFFYKGKYYKYIPGLQSFVTWEIHSNDLQLLDFPIWGIDYTNLIFILALCLVIILILLFVWLFKQRVKKKIEQAQLKVLKTKTMKKITNLIFLCSLLIVSVVSAQNARLQVIHNSPDLAAALVDVYVNDDLLLNDFAFRTATPFIDVPAGVELSIDIAPSTSTSSAESLYNLTATLTADETYIVVANGIVSPTGYSPAQPFALNVFAQGREVASNSANTEVLVNHGSPDAPTVDVVETSVPAGTIVNDISFPDFAGYLELPNLDFTLDVRDATGTVTVASYQAPLQTLGLDGAAITVLASGFLNPAVNSNGPAFGLWVALASGGELIPLPQIPLSVTDFNSSKISIYPNPTSSQLNLDIPFDYENFKGIIYDLSGREVKTFSNPNSIYVSDLNNGLYILNVTLDDVNFNQKFLKN